MIARRAIERDTWSSARIAAAGAALLLLALPAPVRAQSAADFAELRAQLAAMRAEQSKAAARIATLEDELARGRPAIATAPPAIALAAPPAAPQTPLPASRLAAPREPSAAASVNAAGGSAPGALPATVKSRLTLNGDMRVRYEANAGDRDARNRDRGVVRARLRALYALNETLAVGGQIATGDANDPNSTDITLSGFDNDLDLNIDQAYIRLTAGGFTAFGGKIPQPFARTEMVFDGDVSPEGVSVAYRLPLGSASLKATGLYFLVDEAPAGPDSSMIGGQLAFETAASAPLKFEAAAAYYDYRLRSVAGGDIGDFRTNRFAGGRYLSDFNLLDLIGAVQYSGLGERWPVRAVGDYVHNFGATAGDPNGVGIDLLVGRAARQHDWRFTYGYAQTGVDAVLTAFSHDNTNIASNYYQHTLAVDYVPVERVVLNMTYYRYRPKDATFAGANIADDWLDRIRLNLLVNF